MCRYFIAQLACMLVLHGSGLLPTIVKAAPVERASFDCRQAASPSEKTICANVALCRLDFQLGRNWKALLDAFSDSVQRTRMKVDQKTWIARRETCGDDANCIGNLYQDRLSTLDGADPAHRFSGVYEVKDTGSFALYPIGNRYLVSIQTADPQQGSWTCELTGEAESTGDDLEISVEGLVFRARLRDTETLIVPNAGGVPAAAMHFCGLNGTFAFSYLRVRLNP
jgi:uncharacterized protein